MADVKVRSDWDMAFRSVSHGDSLSRWIGWALSPQDLLVLCCLHEAGEHRKKIEELMEDCNFHKENGLLSDGKYDECRKVIMEEWDS